MGSSGHASHWRCTKQPNSSCTGLYGKGMYPAHFYTVFPSTGQVADAASPIPDDAWPFSPRGKGVSRASPSQMVDRSPDLDRPHTLVHRSVWPRSCSSSTLMEISHPRPVLQIAEIETSHAAGFCHRCECYPYCVGINLAEPALKV